MPPQHFVMRGSYKNVSCSACQQFPFTPLGQGHCQASALPWPLCRQGSSAASWKPDLEGSLALMCQPPIPPRCSGCLTKGGPLTPLSGGSEAASSPQSCTISLQPCWRSWRSGLAHGPCTLWHIWPLGWAQAWPRSPGTSTCCCPCALPTAFCSPRSARCPTPCSATTTRAKR